MKYKYGNKMKNMAISGIAMAGGFLTWKLIINTRGKPNPSLWQKCMKRSGTKAPKWTIMASIASGVIRLLLKRYIQKGLAQLED